MILTGLLGRMERMHNWPCISDYDSDTPMFDYSAYEEEEDSGEARQNGVFASSLFLACAGLYFFAAFLCQLMIMC